MQLPPPDVCTLLLEMMNLETRVKMNQVLKPEERFCWQIPLEIRKQHHMLRTVRHVKDIFEELYAIQGSGPKHRRQRVYQFEKMYKILLANDPILDEVPAKLCIALLKSIVNVKEDHMRWPHLTKRVVRLALRVQRRQEGVLANQARNQVPILQRHSIQDYQMHMC